MGRIAISGRAKEDLSNCRVLLLDDAVHSGQTLISMHSLVEKNSAKVVAAYALIARLAPSARALLASSLGTEHLDDFLTVFEEIRIPIYDEGTCPECRTGRWKAQFTNELQGMVSRT